jgi:hypothetical protein
MTNNVDIVLNRLFGGKQANMDAWMAQTQSRRDALEHASNPSERVHLSVAQNNTSALTQLCDSVESDGFALYSWLHSPKDIPSSVSELLSSLSLCNGDRGVIRESGELSLLEDLSGTPKGRFPPYQSKALNWHTDGYYNDSGNSIRCFTLHCIEPATEGGELVLMDDALLILALWQEDPELLRFLSHPEAMMLPRNQDEVGHDRPDRHVPIIQPNADGSLTLRFTTRTQNIQWRCAATQAAAKRAADLIHTNKHWQVRVRLQRGEGVITRNVLHAREPFVDAPGWPKRQMLRGRFNNLPRPTLNKIASTTSEQTHAACE